MPKKPEQGGKKTRKKIEDPNWRPPKKANAFYNTETRLKLMRVDTSPAKKNSILTTFSALKESFSKENFVSPSKLIFSTPEKGALTNSVTTPNGSKLVSSRIVESDDGTLNILLSEDKVNLSELELPSTVLPEKMSVAQGDMNGMTVTVTKETIKAADKLKTRSRSQNNVMKISASKALEEAGFRSPPPDLAQWLHFVPYDVIGEKGQCVKNMGLGTRFANGEMELVNPLIRYLFQGAGSPKSLVISVIPEWVPGFEKIRLLKSLSYEIKEQGKNPKFVRFKFNTLSLASICVTEIPIIRDFIIAKFKNSLTDLSKSAPSKKNKENKPVNRRLF